MTEKDIYAIVNSDGYILNHVDAENIYSVLELIANIASRNVNSSGLTIQLLTVGYDEKHPDTIFVAKHVSQVDRSK